MSVRGLSAPEEQAKTALCSIQKPKTHEKKQSPINAEEYLNQNF